MQRVIERNGRDGVLPIRTVQRCADILERVDTLSKPDSVIREVRWLFENYLDPRVEIGNGNDHMSAEIDFKPVYIMS